MWVMSFGRGSKSYCPNCAPAALVLHKSHGAEVSEIHDTDGECVLIIV